MNPSERQGVALIIPLRIGSTRLHEKPLHMIGEVPLLERMIRLGRNAIHQKDYVRLIVACDDTRVAEYCERLDVPAIMTDPDLPSGTDRVYAAALQMNPQPLCVVNLQGDAPFIPANVISKMLTHMHTEMPEMATVTKPMNQNELELFLRQKDLSPSSGTTAVVVNGKAIWFYKAKPFVKRPLPPKTPVHRHLGLYGYTLDFLERYTSWEPSPYEKIEGLEQLRAIENGVFPEVLSMEDMSMISYVSIDTPIDVKHAEIVLGQGYHMMNEFIE